MISQVLAEALNQQFNYERANQVLYQAISDSLAGDRWPGAAHWFAKQAVEEGEHARRFACYLIEQKPFIQKPTQVTESGETIFPLALPAHTALEAPSFVVAPLFDVFLGAYRREQETTHRIDELYHLAQIEESPVTCEFLLWFIREQADEESTLAGILQELERAADNIAALLILDREYLER